MSETKVLRNYKDSIFRMLFKDKENLLSLYNALNQSDYTDVEDLRKNRAEAIKVSIYEYDEELHFKTLYEEGIEKGRELERELGESHINKLNYILIDMGRIDDLKRATQDKAYQKQLMAELLPE